MINKNKNHFDPKDFQKQFVKALLEPKKNQAFIQCIAPAGKILDGKSALSIHSQGYFYRLTNALKETFEAVSYVLGDEAFFKEAKKFIQKNPSHVYNLGNYGKNFPQFLAKSKHSEQFPFLFDLARLDLAFCQVFHSPKHETLDIETFLEIESYPHATLKFGEAVVFLKLDHEVYEIWKNRTQKQIPAKSILESEYLVIYKKQKPLYIEKLSKKHFELLTILHSGVSLEKSFEVINVEKEDITSIFYFLTSSGIISSLIR